jgi:tetratricopeptide (TPR) repeat protein
MRPKLWLITLAFLVAFGPMEAQAARTSCPNIVGVWNSWASGLFGHGDTTFKSDGTAIHGSGIRGTWKCEGGKLQMSWGGSAPEVFTLRDNKLINSSGGVGFSREGAAQASRSESSTQEKREAPAKQQVAEPQKPERPKEEKVLTDSVGFYDRFAMYGVPTLDVPAGASPDSDMFACSNGSGDTGIAACTREIDFDRKYGEGATSSLTTALLHRATMYGSQGLYDRAVQDFGEAIQINKWPAAYNWRGQTYGMKGDYDRAIADFNQAIRLDSNYAVAFYNRGQTYRAKGEYDLAIKDFSEAIRLNSDYILAYRMRGSAYSSIRKYDAAIDDFSKAIKLSPDYVAAFDGRGMAYLGKKEYERAIQDLDQAIRISPAYADAVHDRGIAINAQTCAGSRAPTQDRLNACRSLIGNSSLSADVRADAYVEHALASATNASSSAEDANRIINDLSEAIRLSPPNAAPAYRARAAISFQRGDTDRALADITKTLELESNSLADLAFRSLLYSSKGESDRATADLDRAIRLMPSVAYLYILRGDVSQLKGDSARALADFENAIKLDSRNAQGAGALAWSRKGDVQSSANDLEAAIASYDEAIRLDPSQSAFSEARDAALKKKNEKGR